MSDRCDKAVGIVDAHSGRGAGGANLRVRSCCSAVKWQDARGEIYDENSLDSSNVCVSARAVRHDLGPEEQFCFGDGGQEEVGLVLSGCPLVDAQIGL